MWREGGDGLEGLPLEEQLLDLAAFLSKDAGYFAARAHAYFHLVRGRPWGGSTLPEALLKEMRRSLAYFLGHVIMAAKYLEADVLEEFVAWSEELGGDPARGAVSAAAGVSALSEGHSPGMMPLGQRDGTGRRWTGRGETGLHLVHDQSKSSSQLTRKARMKCRPNA